MRRKRLLPLCMILMTICISAMAQPDIELGGDIRMRAFYRKDFGLTSATAGSEDWFDSYVRAYIRGYPSPGITAYVRILAERDWGAEGITTIDLMTAEIETEHTTQVDIDLAYFVMEHAWGSPATVTLGRQELLYGEGFLIGRNNTYRTGAYERSPRKAFDAARVSLNLVPFTVDFFGAIIEENYSGSDAQLFGANLTYDYLGTATLDVGLFFDRDPDEGSKTWAFSIRGESEIISIPGLKAKAEFVPQSGKHDDYRDLSAFGGYAGILYGSENTIGFVAEPYIGFNYILMTGEANPGALTGSYGEFDPLYEDEFYGEVNEVNTTLGMNTNAKILNLRVGGKLTENLAVELDFYGFTRAEKVAGSDDFGTELDLKLNYEYTEDMDFGLTFGYFDPDTAIGTEATFQVIGSAKLAF